MTDLSDRLCDEPHPDTGAKCVRPPLHTDAHCCAIGYTWARKTPTARTRVLGTDAEGRLVEFAPTEGGYLERIVDSEDIRQALHTLRLAARVSADGSANERAAMFLPLFDALRHSLDIISRRVA